MNKFIPNFGISDNETNDPVHSFIAAPGFFLNESGLIVAARTRTLLWSENGGKSWQIALENLNLSEPLTITALAVSENFSQNPHIFAGSAGGVLRSIDGAHQWKIIPFSAPPPVISILKVSPNYARDETIFAGTLEDGILISQDCGESWVSWNFGLLDRNIIGLAISPNFKNDESIFAGTESGIFRSTNGGRAWCEVDLPFGFEPVICLEFDPGYAENHTLYAGTENLGLWVSIDEGETWSRLGVDKIVSTVNQIFISEKSGVRYLLIATGEALWLSDDAGIHWEKCLSGSYSDHEISAVLAPEGIWPGACLMVGYTNGFIKTVIIESETRFKASNS